MDEHRVFHNLKYLKIIDVDITPLFARRPANQPIAGAMRRRGGQKARTYQQQTGAATPREDGQRCGMYRVNG